MFVEHALVLSGPPSPTSVYRPADSRFGMGLGWDGGTAILLIHLVRLIIGP